MMRLFGIALAAALIGLAPSCGKGSSKSGPVSCTPDWVNPVSGDPAGGDVVTIKGSSFEANMRVAFGTALDQGVTVNSSTTATVVTPPSPVHATVDVAVILPGGKICVLEDGYTYDGPCLTGGCPGCLIWDAYPTEGPLVGEAMVSIRGAGFVSGMDVAFGTMLSPQVTVISWNELWAITPPSPLAGTFDISVIDSAGGIVCTLRDGYTYGEGCSLVDVTPDTLCPLVSERITVTGHEFQQGAAVRFVISTQPSLEAIDVNVIDEHTIEAATPAPLTIFGSFDVEVENPDGRSCYLRDATSFDVTPPTGTCDINGLNPAFGSIAGGETVIISGNGFEANDRAFFGTYEAQSVTLLPGGELEVITPASSEAQRVVVTVVDRACSRLCAFSQFIYQ